MPQNYKARGAYHSSRDKPLVNAREDTDARVISKKRFLGVSTATREILEKVPRIARATSPVLIQGETGTGKDTLARLIHQNSQRDSFHVIDCSAIPDTLFAREIFGHVKGAFTGAERDHIGRLRAAQGGTAMFKEIDQLETHNQCAMLRVLEEGEVMPLGGTHPIELDVRYIHTAQTTLEESIASGALREDLYYRLNAITISIPPLRERPDDLAYLLDHYIEIEVRALERSRPRLTHELRALLLEYPWPGNTAELRSMLRGLLTVTDADPLSTRHLPAETKARLEQKLIRHPETRTFSIPATLGFQQQTERFQQLLLQRVWSECKGKRRELAEAMLLAPHQLRYLTQKLGLKLDPDQAE